MLNYANLNDVEFEYLCQDVMSKKLGIELCRFAAGRDGGIDLTDNPATKNIIVQVKHYDKTDISGLISSLKKEIKKVEQHNPNQYYVCCSKELSHERINAIYELFSEYMGSPKNIITLIEIDDFLMYPENVDILRKHYKLWISSTNILQDIYNNDIFIDCEVLLSTVHDDANFFVQTSAYDRALGYLEKNKCLFIVGAPGVGKTITSKMVILHYAVHEYRVRYTTDGTDLSALKRSLSQNPDVKEIILLDDCFGQAYFNMKETQGNELLSLIKYVNISINKRLVLNSRVTIYQEANVRTPDLIRSFENKEYKVYIMDMSAMEDIEKAKILYNHLYFKKIPPNHFSSIKRDKNYRKIIEHPNYNPRIIEFVTTSSRYKDVSPEGYFDFVLKHFDAPRVVWDNEYEQRLENIDRMLLTTLYSLSDTTCPIDFLENCFNKRIENLHGVDPTVNQFSNSLSRLQDAFVTVTDRNNQKMVTMVNPSVNDYIRLRLSRSSVEKKNLIEGAASVRQLKRLLEESDYKEKEKNLFHDASILDYCFENEDQKITFIANYVSQNHLLDIRYQDCMSSYLKDSKHATLCEGKKIYPIHLFLSLLEDDVRKFYGVDDLLQDLDLLKKILSQFELSDLVDAVKKCCVLYGDEEFLSVYTSLVKDAVEYYCGEVSVDEFNINVYEHINVHEYYGEYYKETDVDTIVESVEQEVENLVIEDVYRYLDDLPEKLDIPDSFISDVSIYVSGARSLVKSHLRDDYDDDWRGGSTTSDFSEIDLIFNR